MEDNLGWDLCDALTSFLKLPLTPIFMHFIIVRIAYDYGGLVGVFLSTVGFSCILVGFVWLIAGLFAAILLGSLLIMMIIIELALLYVKEAPII